MLRSLSRLLALVVLAITSLSTASHASAQARPYLASGSGQFALNHSDFTGDGQATYLGRYTEIGSVAFAPTSTPGILAVNGWSHYTAANGDRLYAVITGTVDLGTGAITATATYAGGTGRFANASGSSALLGQLLGDGALTITAAGSISF